MLFDFFIVRISSNGSPGEDLRSSLEARHGASCFLTPPNPTGSTTLSDEHQRAMSDSRVVVILIGPSTDLKQPDQEELAVALELADRDAASHTIVPVLVGGARAEDLPDSLVSRKPVDADSLGWDAAADELAARIPAAEPPPAQRALVHSSVLLDQVWAYLEPAYTGGPGRTPEEYRMRITLEGDDLVAPGQRITAAEFSQKLTSPQLEHIRRLEKSMEINLAAWERAYPHRALSPEDRAIADRTLDAMGEDLASVLDLVEQSGFYLDDHYQSVRYALRDPGRR